MVIYTLLQLIVGIQAMQIARQIKNAKRRKLRQIKAQKILLEDDSVGLDTRQFTQQEQVKLIYGTNVAVSSVKKELKKFIQSYQKPSTDPTSPPQRVYRNKLINFQDIQDPQVVFEVSGKDIFQFSKDIYFQFIYFPCEMFQLFDEAIKQLFLSFFASEENEEEVNQRITEKAQLLITSIIYLRDQQTIKIHNLLPKYINRLISINALVTRVSQIIPEMHGACFQCEFCQNLSYIKIQNARATTPTLCKQCYKSNTMQINHNLSKFIDKQYIKLQQLPQQLEEGSTPAIIQALAYQDNVDKFKSGDCVQIIGIYRASPVYICRNQSQIKSVFRAYIDIISLRVDGQFSKIKLINNSFTDDDKRRFYKLAESPQIIQNVVKSFAPSIIEHQLVKLGLLAQIFGGTPMSPLENRTHLRSDINICLIGDPSTAKSQLLKQVHKITTRSMMVCGSGSSTHGLTVAIKKDPETRQFILEGGALVMSDGGICCIDQFDKIGANSQTALLEAMQQQTISVAKAGIVCQLKARSSLLVAANPVKSKYDTSKSVVENINLSPALLSRFDLIYILLDIPSKQYDLKIANHIVSMYSSRNQLIDSPIPHKDLLRYIAFARDYIHPTISEQIGIIIRQKYCQMRKAVSNNKVISSTPRQLQSIIRLSQAYAKMRLSERVQKIDVDLAVKVIYEATLKAATDPETGKIDIGIITTGKSQSKREEEDYIGRLVKKLLTANVSTYRKPTYINKLQENFRQRQNVQIQKEIFQAILRKIQAEDLIVIFGQDPKNLQFKLHKNFESITQ